MVWEIRAASAVLRDRGDKAEYIGAATFRNVVKSVAAVTGGWHVGDRVSYGWGVPKAGGEGDGDAVAGDVNKPSAPLRHTEVSGVEDSVGADVAEGIKALAKIREALVGCERGYVFHHHGARKKGLDYALELG